MRFISGRYGVVPAPVGRDSTSGLLPGELPPVDIPAAFPHEDRQVLLAGLQVHGDG